MVGSVDNCRIVAEASSLQRFKYATDIVIQKRRQAVIGGHRCEAFFGGCELVLGLVNLELFLNPRVARMAVIGV